MTEYILIIVGRSEDANSFVGEIQRTLPESFSFEAIHSLDEYSDVDKKDRYIMFASSTDENVTAKQLKDLVYSLKLSGFGASVHEDIESAIMFAKEEYDFDDDSGSKQEKFLEMRKKFPLFTASETEQIQIFDSLYHTGKVRPLRARYKDEESIILAHITMGVDEVRVTPMMLLIDDNIHEDLEIPFGDTD